MNNEYDGTGYPDTPIPPKPNFKSVQPDGPWRCDGPCGALIYKYDLVPDKDGGNPYKIPKPGLKTPLPIKGVGFVCELCYDMYYIVNNYMSREMGHPPYWFRSAQEEWSAEQKEIQRNIKKLRSDGDDHFHI